MILNSALRIYLDLFTILKLLNIKQSILTNPEIKSYDLYIFLKITIGSILTHILIVQLIELSQLKINIEQVYFLQVLILAIKKDRSNRVNRC